MLSKDTYDGIMEPDKGELYVISGSGFGFPSNRYIDLELGASGTNYTAPANGWFYIRKGSTATLQYVYMLNENTTISTNVQTPANGSFLDTTIAVKKGDTVNVQYTLGGTTQFFRFIYAEGEN